MTSGIERHSPFFQLTAFLCAIGLSATTAGAQEATGAALSCVLSAAPLPEAGGTGERAFEALVACGSDARAVQPGGDVAQLPFPARPGERILIGASLSDKSPTEGPTEVDPTPDFDFPVRVVAIEGADTDDSWSFGAEGAAAAQYDYLILRVWNETALADCPEGRDGCRKYGYILRWDERRVEDALELTLR